MKTANLIPRSQFSTSNAAVQERLAEDLATMAALIEELLENEFGATKWEQAQSRIQLIARWPVARARAGFYAEGGAR